MALKLGLFSMTTGPCSYPDGAARVARAAEAAGFESLWGGARDPGCALRIRAGAGRHREEAELEGHRDLLAPHSTRRRKQYRSGIGNGSGRVSRVPASALLAPGSYVVAAREIGVVVAALLGMLSCESPGRRAGSSPPL
jgi:hypothetical protein